MKKKGLVPICVFNGELLNKRQFNYRNKKFLDSLSDEERKKFDSILRSYSVIWRCYFDKSTR